MSSRDLRLLPTRFICENKIERERSRENWRGRELEMESTREGEIETWAELTPL